MNYHPDSTWLGTEVEELRKLAEDGMSASLIGDKIGKSKNAVIGKMHRLGITKAKRTVTSPPPKPQPPQTAKPPASPSTEAPPRPVVKTKPPPRQKPTGPYRDLFAGTDRMGSNAQFALQVDECKWPIGQPGTPDFQFCAAKRIDGVPYCKTHARIAYGKDVG